MPPTRVVDVLAEVFRTFGFDTTIDAHPEGMSRTMYEVALLAEKGGMDVAVAIQPGPLTDTDPVEAHARMVRDIGAYYGLLVTTAHASDAACEAAARHRLIVWDRNALEAVIGKAVLAELHGGEPTEIPIAEVLAYGRTAADPAPTPHAPTDTSSVTSADPGALAAIEASPSSGVVAGRGWYLQTNARSDTPPAADTREEETENTWTAPVADPDPVYKRPEKPSLAQIAAMGGIGRVPRSGGMDPRTFNPTEGALLAPAVSKERAAGLARERIYTIDDTRLRYLPKRVYRWSVECFVEGSVETRTLQGTRLVDVATRAVEDPADWSPSRSLREGTFDVPVDHKPVRLEPERARGLVLDDILEETAREIVVEENDSSSDVMMTQKKRVRAHRDDVRIDDDGLHWCPVWCFSGVNGEVEVDALNGSVLSESLRTSTSNTIVL